MDVVGSEIGQKMRSAIKAKLTELGCYVDDELPDYVMVMVANKRTRVQMEDDLQLFLGDNTELFVNWLHQVLKKLQEVTVTAPLNPTEREKSKERSVSKEKKSKEKKDKEKSKKSESSKKSKKKVKEKLHRKKEEKKSHKSKKKSKHHEMIRPNIPPLLMNMEKESEPSITDVFAGQILKNHGIIIDPPKDDSKVVDKKPIAQEPKWPIRPIIDPASISSQPESSQTNEIIQTSIQEINKRNSASSTGPPIEEQIKEMNDIEAKIQGLKQKLAEQLDSMSDDEDFLNIRTEAEELMNDFAEDVFQEISQPAPAATPPLQMQTSPSPSVSTVHQPQEVTIDPIETLPQIELKLPKRPIRERLGIREEMKRIADTNEKETTNNEKDSPERFTPEKEPEHKSQSKSAKSRLGDPPETHNRNSSLSDDSSDKPETSSKRLTSKVSVLEGRSSRASCASVVRVRPRPRVAAPASSLLLRAVADAHKSLLNIPPKIEPDVQKVKRALVLPMRRCVDAQKIVIQVQGVDASLPDSQGDNTSTADVDSETDDKSSKDNNEYTPAGINRKASNSVDYKPSRNVESRPSDRGDDTLIIETINIHNPTVDKEKSTKFIVTMDGFNPNAFLAKKLMTEGLLDDEQELSKDKIKETKSVLKINEKVENRNEKEEESTEENNDIVNVKVTPSTPPKKRLSDTSEESDTQVIIKQEKSMSVIEKRKSSENASQEDTTDESTAAKKRKASPIVFDVAKKEKVRERERTESVSSDNHVTVTTNTNTHKYDSVPPLSIAERKLVPCRAFPLCRYGASCAFSHPRCKFAAACTRRSCPYSHPPAARHLTPQTPAPAATSALLSSHVVPAANYKCVVASSLPTICKYYPSCSNPACRYYHPRPCRYGAACLNKLDCNFYHPPLPSTPSPTTPTSLKWRYQP